MSHEFQEEGEKKKKEVKNAAINCFILPEWPFGKALQIPFSVQSMLSVVLIRPKPMPSFPHQTVSVDIVSIALPISLVLHFLQMKSQYFVFVSTLKKKNLNKRKCHFF